MNATPDHLDDEILSALLDGVAADSGFDADAHVRACDRCAARQEELAAARTALAAAPVEPVDELTRRRLLAAALTTAGGGAAGGAAASPLRARARWTSRHRGLVGSAAAVVLAVLVGIPFVLDNDSKSGDADTTLAAEAPTSAGQESASAYLGDLGDLSDRQSLRLRLNGSDTFSTDYGYSGAPAEPSGSGAAGASTPMAPMPASAPSAGALASTTTTPMAGLRAGGSSGSATKSAAPADSAAAASTTNAQTESARDEAAAGRDRADIDACVTTLLYGPARGGRLAASGTGTFQGRPSVVAVFDLNGGRIAFITDRSGCTVRDRFPV